MLIRSNATGFLPVERGYATKLLCCNLAGLLMTVLGCATVTEPVSLDMASPEKPEVEKARTVQEEAMFHNNAGGRMIEQGNLPGAAREFREAIRLSPRDPAAHNNLGMVLHMQEQPVEALGEFREAVRLSPGFAPGWSNLGFAFFELDQLIPAVEAWQVAAGLNQRLAGTWAGLAVGLLASGAVNPAIESYRQAIRLDPRYADLVYLRTVRHWSARALDHADRILKLTAARQQAFLTGSFT